MSTNKEKKHGFNLTGNAAELYESVLVPAWLEQWAHTLVDYAQLNSGWSVLDVACGTGVVTRIAEDAVSPNGKVYGLDVNESMLDVARSFSNPNTSRIHWINRDVADTKLDENSIHIVLSQQGLQYFPEKSAALEEIHRVLVPSGRAIFSLWKEHSVYTSALVKALERHVSAEAAMQQDGSRRTPQKPELSEIMSNAGFSDVVVETHSLEINTPAAKEFVPRHLSAMPVGQIYNSLDSNTQNELINFVESELREFTHGQELRYTDTVNIVSGIKTD